MSEAGLMPFGEEFVRYLHGMTKVVEAPFGLTDDFDYHSYVRVILGNLSFDSMEIARWIIDDGGFVTLARALKRANLCSREITSLAFLSNVLLDYESPTGFNWAGDDFFMAWVDVMETDPTKWPPMFFDIAPSIMSSGIQAVTSRFNASAFLGSFESYNDKQLELLLEMILQVQPASADVTKSIFLSVEQLNFDSLARALSSERCVDVKYKYLQFLRELMKKRPQRAQYIGPCPIFMRLMSRWLVEEPMRIRVAVIRVLRKILKYANQMWYCVQCMLDAGVFRGISIFISDSDDLSSNKRILRLLMNCIDISVRLCESNRLSREWAESGLWSDLLELMNSCQDESLEEMVVVLHKKREEIEELSEREHAFHLQLRREMEKPIMLANPSDDFEEEDFASILLLSLDDAIE